MILNAYSIPGCISNKNTDFMIFSEVCKISNLSPEKVIQNNKNRLRELVVIRQVTMSLLRLKHKRSLTYCGNFFSKDHATVLHAMETVKNLLETDRLFRAKYGHLFEGVKFPVSKRQHNNLFLKKLHHDNRSSSRNNM